MVGDGVSTFYFAESGSGFVAAVGTFWEACKLRFPSGILINTAHTGDLIDEATGQLSGSWLDGTPQVTLTTGPSVYAQGVGARVKWSTSGIRNGRRVAGSTFMVPIDSSILDAQGTILAAGITTFQNAATALVGSASNELRIYSRPSSGQVGTSSSVVSASVPDHISWLRSRRT